MRTSILYCQQSGDHYSYFYKSRKVTSLCNPTKQTLQAQVTECDVSPDCYWAWWNNEAGSFTMVYNKWQMVEVCFPYGTKAAEDRGRGRVLPVKVEILDREEQL